MRESERDRVNREDGMAPGGVMHECLQADLRAMIGERYPVMLRIEGEARHMSPGSVWRVAVVTTHHEPSGMRDVADAVWTRIEFHPAEERTP